jgi:hypothetical protein
MIERPFAGFATDALEIVRARHLEFGVVERLGHTEGPRVTVQQIVQ